jgi:site-specific DNA-methyltransferase (adenine-specific)
MIKARAPRNRTLSCSEQERVRLAQNLRRLTGTLAPDDLSGVLVNQDLFEAAACLPRRFADLIILDPPYNISKDFNGDVFRQRDRESYSAWFSAVLDLVAPTLREDGTLYACADWKTSTIIAPILETRFRVRNRITWEREKGRGAKSNWKNNTEDIWFCTASEDYHFDVEAVKLRRKVIAPYRDAEGRPKDWHEADDGNYRLTHPSNIWNDITVPFWSMPENTDHPTQKPEKLIAKLVLASSQEGDLVFDPFLGSGTTAVVAKKLRRRFFGIEQNTEYCCWAQKRLENAEFDTSIQGYSDGVFWERNSLAEQKVDRERSVISSEQLGTLSLFR